MNYSQKITVIVTALPPIIDGVGDYAWHLAQQMRQDFGIETEFVVGNPTWPITSGVDEFLIQRIPRRASSELSKIIWGSSFILLHYVGYGYAARGCPVWLVQDLEKWRNASNEHYLLTMFHELYAYRPKLFSSQFLTFPLQRNLAQRLAKLSDRCLTSKQEYSKKITQLSGGKHLDVLSLPVFSNVGEPPLEQLLPLTQRSKRLVIFGGRGTRARVYQRSLLALERTCQELQIEEILDIGPSLDFELPLVNQTRVECLGLQTNQAISRFLSDAIVGFFNYPTDFLAKSSLFAAYCAHRLLPIGSPSLGKNEDGLEAGKNYWIADAYPAKMDLSAGQVVADQAYSWYQQHKLSQQAKIFSDHVFPSKFHYDF